jgi:hypothetical protein
MATGRQLHAVFVCILCGCRPAQPGQWWEQFKQYLCDDLQHHMCTHLQIDAPSTAQIKDYCLYCLELLLQETNNTLSEYTGMPVSVQ